MGNYNADTIKSLDYFEHIRKYPGMFIGSKDLEGLHHCVKEIISNSIDEYLNGECTEIEVKIYKDKSISVKDNGRGIPHGKHESGVSLLTACFGIANTGGKFNNATGESGYNTSGGEHGTGSKAVNALSKKMICITKSQGIKETSEFSKGVLLKEETDKEEGHGTFVRFYPDETIFETIEFDIAKLKSLIKEFSFLCKKLKFTFINENNNSVDVYYSENGLFDYLEYLSKGKPLVGREFYFDEKEGTFEVEVAFCYNTSYSPVIKLYTNNIPQEKGTHLTGFKTAFTAGMNNFAREKGWLKDKDDNLTGGDYEEGLNLIINFKMIDPVFKGQNKEELSSSEGRTYVQKLSSIALREIFETHEKDIKLIFEKAVSAKRARNAAKKARDATRKINKSEKGLKAKMALSDKFIDCKSKDPSKRSLLLVEGNSAAGSALEARNVETDCIYMLRGKVISPLKQSIDKLLSNQEISDIIKVIGAGFGNDNFDISKMNFDKIVITSDQDSDGFAIELLLITFFYTYMRPLVEHGKLYRAVTPLYIVKTGKEKFYCYTEKELSDWKEKHNNTKYELSHCKGLGEVSAEVLKEICFEKQRYKRITVSDAEATKDLLYILEGPDVAPRKKFIYDNANTLGFKFI